jgi:hypothetical protein
MILNGNARFRSHLEVILRFALMAPALALALCTHGAYAASVTLYLSGTFTDGAALGGTITIDSTAGTVTALNATVGSPEAGSYTVSQGTGTGNGYFNVGIGTTAGVFPSLSLVLATNTLVGYTGGPLCNLQATCNGVVAGIYKTQGSSAIQLGLGTASLTPPALTSVPSAPALSPWALVNLALLLVASAALLQRRAIS